MVHVYYFLYILKTNLKSYPHYSVSEFVKKKKKKKKTALHIIINFFLGQSSWSK